MLPEVRKRLLVEVNGKTRGMALVDACISADMFVAAKAVWQVEQIRELYVTFASSEAIGLFLNCSRWCTSWSGMKIMV